jgi:hypothetical protein
MPMAISVTCKRLREPGSSFGGQKLPGTPKLSATCLLVQALNVYLVVWYAVGILRKYILKKGGEAGTKVKKVIKKTKTSLNSMRCVH